MCHNELNKEEATWREDIRQIKAELAVINPPIGPVGMEEANWLERKLDLRIREGERNGWRLE